MKKQIILLIAIIGLSACGDKKQSSLDINNTSALVESIQGKWHGDTYKPTMNNRIEIVGNKMKLWQKLEAHDWKSEQTAERSFTLGQPTKDVDGYYMIRYLEFDQTDLPLSFRAIEPMWIVCDKEWGESPVFMHGGGVGFLTGWN